MLFVAILGVLTVILSSDYYYDQTENKASFSWNVGKNRLAISYGKGAKGSLLAKRETTRRILDIICDWACGDDGNVHLEYANTVLSHKKEIQEDSRFGQYVGKRGQV